MWRRSLNSCSNSASGYALRSITARVSSTLNNLLFCLDRLDHFILAPYFWVLWIWRHNDKETDKNNNERAIERSVILDEQDKFNRAFNMAGSVSENLQLVGIEKLCEFLKLFENDKDKYEKYCEDAIVLLANSYITIGDKFKRKTMTFEVFKSLNYLQRNFFCILGYCVNKNTSIKYVDEKYLNLFDCTKNELINERSLFNVKVKLSTLESILFEIDGEEVGYAPEMFYSDKNRKLKRNIKVMLAFQYSEFIIDEELSDSMVEYLSSSMYISNSSVRVICYKTSLKYMEKINDKNPSLGIDIEEYKRKCL